MLEQLLASRAGTSVGLFLLGASLAAIYMNATEPPPRTRRNPALKTETIEILPQAGFDLFSDQPQSGSPTQKMSLDWPVFDPLPDFRQNPKTQNNSWW